MIIATPHHYTVGTVMNAVLMNADGRMSESKVRILRERTQEEWRTYAEELYAPYGLDPVFLYAVHMGCYFFYEIEHVERVH